MIQDKSANTNSRIIDNLVRLNAECLKRAFWLSGTPCAGKTTVSTAIAERLGWVAYHVDEHWDSHCARANSENMPIFYRITRLTGDALWLRPIEDQINSEPLFVEESFLLVLEDIINILKTSKKNLVIDASVVPTSALQVIPNNNHIFYLIPEEKFQRDNYVKRESIKSVLAKTTNPELAFENWMIRDASYARWLEHDVDRNKLARLSVNGRQSIEETIKLVTDYFMNKSGHDLRSKI